MKMTKNKIILIGSATVVVSGIIFLIINKVRKKNLIKEITKILDEGITQYGSSEDLKANAAFNPKYWKTIPQAGKLMTIVQVRSIEKQIYDAVNDFRSDSNKIISVFKQFRAKSEVSQVAEYFSIDYDRDLYEFVRKTDHTIFENITTIGGLIGAPSTMDEIQRIVEGLPNY